MKELSQQQRIRNEIMMEEDDPGEPEEVHVRKKY